MQTTFAKELASKSPSEWTILTNDGTNITALNQVKSESYTGTMLNFASKFTAPAIDLVGGQLILKSTSGSYQLTGGTNGVKTVVVSIPIPNGYLDDFGTRVNIEYTASYTNSANAKQIGVMIGKTFGTAIDVRTQSPTTSTNMTDKIVFQRSGATPARFWLTVPNNARIFGVAPFVGGATVDALLGAGVAPTDTDLNLYFVGTLALNTEQITFEHIHVELQRSS